MKDTVTKPISPNERWILSSPLNAITITNWEFIILFGIQQVVHVEKGVINFRLKNHFYYYTIYKADLLLKTNISSVRIRFDPGDLSKVHLFDIEDDDYLETIDPSPRVQRNKFNRSQEATIALKNHCDAVDLIDETVETYLTKYADVVKKVDAMNNDVPIDLIGIDDTKDTKDKAELNYFLETMNTIEILQDDRRRSKKAATSSDRRGEASASQRAVKYGYLAN